LIKLWKRADAAKVSKGRPQSPLVAPQREILQDGASLTSGIPRLRARAEGFPIALRTPSGSLDQAMDS